MKKEKIIELADIIKSVESSCKSLPELQDKGACNMDTVIFNAKGWTEADLNLLAELSGIQIGDKITNSWYKCYVFLFFTAPYMANGRTKVHEFARVELLKAGVDCMIWYQLD